MDLDELLEGVVKMIREDHVHNINFVTPDHFFPHAFQLVFLLRRRGYDLPIVYNLSGYQSLDMLKMAEDYADIYLPDFKYADSSLSTRLSKCKDYPKVALEAIAEMVRQKGFLNYSESRSELANKGTMVRHLILPGRVENSLNALTSVFLEFGAGLPISLMSQYIPVIPQEENDLNRPITREEFDKVYSHALDLGFGQLFVQFPEQLSSDQSKPSPFLPDFLRAEPFAGEN
jgi:putative pyruvate formate lyase activating enzyme